MNKNKFNPIDFINKKRANVMLALGDRVRIQT